MRVYQPKGSQFYWFELRWRGEHIRESTKMTDRDDAMEYAVNFRTKLKFGEIGIKERAVKKSKTVLELLDKLQADFEARKKLTQSTFSTMKFLKTMFGAKLADQMDSECVEAAIKQMRETGISDNTIHNRFQYLKQAYRHAKAIKFCDLSEPVVPRLKMDHPREGFFERDDLDRIVQYLPPVIADCCLLSFLIGWRRGAILGLEWSDVRDGRLYLRGVLSKNGQPYFVPLQGELGDIMERRRMARSVTLPEGGTVLSSFIFHRNGKRIAEFKYEWWRASVLAGFGRMVCRKCDTEQLGWHARCVKCRSKELGYRGRLFHDFRRSAVRSLVKSGVDRKTAMLITGHKTEAIFTRYQIVPDDDLSNALDNVFRYNEAKRKKIVAIPKANDAR